ncbi:MAG TPA: dihydrofolate reductase family protein [Sedimentisphaerales bacterium]|jgi:dihydrofolate reductase|nr:dihydrofolate reductase family protein [Sedimentisphaerales bacterium]HNU30372.1 dihydrofolate reductase family protein [Sedimentisphaerales bacterium]
MRMPKTILYIASSLDGYIARADGGIDWLSVVDSEGTDYGYAEFYSGVDAIAMGSHTYQQVLGFGEWPYPGRRVFVFTHRSLERVTRDVRLTEQPPAEFVCGLDHAGVHTLWLAGGGDLVASFMQNKLIDEYIISIVPAVLGDGIRLFREPLPRDHLELIRSTNYPSGLVQLHYRSTLDR